MRGFGLRIKGLKVEGLGFGIQGLGFRATGRLAQELCTGTASRLEHSGQQRRGVNFWSFKTLSLPKPYSDS